MTHSRNLARRSRAFRRTALLAATIATASVGFAGPAAGSPTDPVVEFTPTLTLVPGGNCAAVINAVTVPQERAGQFGVKVQITQTGHGCAAYRVAVRWRNLDSGYADGQSHRVDGNGTIDAPGGVIIGMGMSPGVGRIEASIITTEDSYPQHPELQHIAGRATFTLG